MSKKRTHAQKHRLIQDTLEGYRRFDYDYVSYGTHWFTPDGDYRYRGSVPHRMATAVVRAILTVLAPILIKVCYGAKVTGRKNLKAIGKSGAVSAFNHFSYFDTLFVRQALGQFRSYHTMAPWNNKTGLGGAIIRLAGMIPLSGNLAASRNLNREIERLLKKGKIVNFYVEQAMWVNYQKPRPMKEGAVYYAVKYNVPLVPVFCTFKRNRRGHMKKLRINILPPLYPDRSLPRKESVAALKAAAEEEWKRCYEQAYGIPLEYLPCRSHQSEK